jgi:hypothetical protein
MGILHNCPDFDFQGVKFAGGKLAVQVRQYLYLHFDRSFELQTFVWLSQTLKTYRVSVPCGISVRLIDAAQKGKTSLEKLAFNAVDYGPNGWRGWICIHNPPGNFLELAFLHLVLIGQAPSYQIDHQICYFLARIFRHLDGLKPRP